MRKQASSKTPAAQADAKAQHAAKVASTTIRVLLLSDQPIVVMGLERLVEAGRPAMTLLGTARHVEEAVRSMKDEPADVVLFDLDGEVDGQGITELLDAGRTRVLALTTSRDPEFCDAAVLAGASGVINTRDAAGALLKAIEKVHAGEFWLDRVATGRIFVAIARQRAARDPEQGKIALLTRKERLTVSEIARDASANGREIARRLCISEHTLRNHLTSIYSKLGLRSRMELYAYATKHRLVAAGGVRQALPKNDRKRPHRPATTPD
jgi:two-component system, NarL family, nitrate/nitrite response regulator NarL